MPSRIVERLASSPVGLIGVASGQREDRPRRDSSARSTNTRSHRDDDNQRPEDQQHAEHVIVRVGAPREDRESTRSA